MGTYRVEEAHSDRDQYHVIEEGEAEVDLDSLERFLLENTFGGKHVFGTNMENTCLGFFCFGTNNWKQVFGFVLGGRALR